MNNLLYNHRVILRKLFDLFNRLMGSQWGCPSGLLGWFAGKLMERGNAAMNELAIEALDVQPGDAVLEVGFGPGVALERIAEQADGGFAAGVEPSELMVRQAARRLRSYVDAGRAEVRAGNSSDIPYPDATFDRVLSANTIYFWEDLASGFREIRRVVKPDGRFVLVFRAMEGEGGLLVHGGSLHMHGMVKPARVAEVAEWMREAGFKDLEQRQRDAPFGPHTITAVALAGTAANPS